MIHSMVWRGRSGSRKGSVRPMSLQHIRAFSTTPLFCVLVAAAAPAAHAASFEFDARRTEVRFVYTMGLGRYRGRFTRVAGKLDFDDARIEQSRVSAQISTASLTTGEPIVDDELKGSAFFDAKAAPVITFTSRIVKADAAADALEVAGDITIRGITKPVTLKVTVEPHDDPALKHDQGARKFLARTRIKRSAFNMTDYKSMVGDDVEIEIDAIVKPARPKAVEPQAARPKAPPPAVRPQ